MAFLCYLVVSGHYFLQDGSPVLLTSPQIFHRTANAGRPTWTFMSQPNFRIHFRFQDYNGSLFSCRFCCVSIGDGLELIKSTTLAYFCRMATPSNVTSITNAAWLRVFDLFYNFEMLSLEITGVEKSGNHYC